MTLRLLPWEPEYGTNLRSENDEVPSDEPRPYVDLGCEVAAELWSPREPKTATGRVPVQMVDGVRRAEAYAMDVDDEGQPVFGLFGSYGVGAARCDAKGARLLEETFAITRRYLHTGKGGQDWLLAAGRTALEFQARPARAAAKPGDPARTAADLVATLNRSMLDAETALALTLSEDESAITLVDGSLRGRAMPENLPGRLIAGYIKGIQEWYVGGKQLDVLIQLDVRGNERSPIFLIDHALLSDDATREDRALGRDARYSWYVRLAALDAQFHPLAGLARLEAPANQPFEDVVRLADDTAMTLPALASSPMRDPRAPQNLTPVGALEQALTHRLGDRLMVRRLLNAAVGRPAREAV
ncbi:MAG: hypothetical protein GEU80_15135 [Dehalococcoidia bacterium]|nr:hypothetical protein [Dehalococcoidia bacterium]